MSTGNEQRRLMQANDQDVWQAFRNGDIQALEHIYRANVKSLFNYGMKIHPVNEVIEDCIQELFIDLWNQKTRLNQTDNIHFYLLKALRWKVMKYMEARKRYDKRVHEHTKDSEVKFSLPYESQLINERINSENKKKLYEALNKLPARQKEVIHLLFFKKFSYEEISEIMSMNLRSVYTLAWKAISSMRKHMSDFLSLLICWLFT